MDVTVVDHPLAARQLTVLRDERTDRVAFRRAMDDLSAMLVYEATRTVATVPVEVRTPLATTTGTRLVEPPLVVPVLRAGLGMLGGVLRLLPDTETAFVGLSRDEATFEPRAYMSSVPDDIGGRPVLVLDPMLATGGSLAHTCGLLAERRAGPIHAVCVLAAPEGIERIRATGHVGVLTTAAIDERLDEQAFIVPGLGDAGDRLFGTA
ncbi:MAG: uracil phosphoribosyltransferase [Acidimicrobiia bacterium]